MLTIEEQTLIEIIIAFEKKANEMIQMLAKEFNLNLSEEDPFSKLLRSENNLRKGSLKDNWKYCFHGDACDFENAVNNQFLHVKINRESNFGAIDDFYLFKFMQTTDSLRYALKIFKTEIIFLETLKRLEEKEILINIDQLPFLTKILNKEFLR